MQQSALKRTGPASVLDLSLIRAKPVLPPICLAGEVQLKRGCVHEITGMAADGFAAVTLGSTKGPIVWIGRGKDVRSVCPLAAALFFDPNRLVTTECLTRTEILWAGEQALRSKGAECVIIHLGQGPNLRESRRLQLAAEQGRSVGLILIERTAQSSAAQTRWQCDPVKPDTAAANDSSQWIWRLTKNKAGKLGTWRAGWQTDTQGEQDGRTGYATCIVDKIRTPAA